MSGKVRKECILASLFAYAMLRWLKLLGDSSRAENWSGKTNDFNKAVVLIWFCWNADILFPNLKSKQRINISF